MKLKAIIFLALTVSVSTANAAQAYKWIDEHGKVHFSDKRPEGQQAEQFELKKIQTIQGVSYERSPIDTGRKVIIYTASWCGYCKKAKAYFKRKGIEYTEMDIEKSSAAEKQFKKLGGTGVPVILVGDKRMNGFSEAGFEQIYQ